MPLPVSTLSAWILIVKVPLVSSGEEKVKEASHLSNFPAIVVDDFTWNLIELCTGVTSKIGPCALHCDGSKAEIKRQRIAARMARSVTQSHFIVNDGVQPSGACQKIQGVNALLVITRFINSYGARPNSLECC